MRKILKKIGMGVLSLIIVIGLHAPLTEALVVQNQATIHNSWKQVSFDGVDEVIESGAITFGGLTASGGKALSFVVTTGSSFNSTIGTNGVTRLFRLYDAATGTGDKFAFVGIRTRTTWGDRRMDMILDVGGAVYSNTGATTSIVANTTYHVVIQTDGTTPAMYINGVSQTMTSWAGGGANGAIWWGNVSPAPDTFNLFPASAMYIDQMTFYNDDLTATEVENLYAGGKIADPMAIVPSKVVVMIPLGEAEDGVSTFYDVVGGDTFSGTNLETTDIISTDYY